LVCLYGTAKMILDSITAYLFLRNNVPTGFTDRVDYFLSDVLERPESLKLKTRLRDYLDELPAWARFKTTGDLSALATALGRTPGNSDLVPLAKEAWERYTGYAEVFWRAILSDVSKDDATECDLVGIGRIYERLERSPRSVVRAFKMLKRGRAPKGLFSTPRTLWRSRLGSPRLLAYLTASITYLSFSHSVDWDRVDRMILRYCPFALPSGYRSFTTDEKREAVIKQLRLLHHGVLLGRKGK
ncbi:MAG: hypothetical protein KAW67_08385, partial [Candidatus Eisenbacteria sp.]|nr:hypothetical protein [Candidatus Eisenbacteria bacterium]